MGSSVTLDPELLAAFRRTVRAKIARDLEREAAQAERLRQEVVPRVAEAGSGARARGLCDRAWLFGSFAWGAPGERSDVDLLVDGDADGVAALVDRACGRMVLALRLEEAPESLRVRVFSDGKPL